MCFLDRKDFSDPQGFCVNLVVAVDNRFKTIVDDLIVANTYHGAVISLDQSFYSGYSHFAGKHAVEISWGSTALQVAKDSDLNIKIIISLRELFCQIKCATNFRTFSNNH